ncbi:FAD-dependent oxidoreductase [Amycolatopsis sp. cg13]|uniref:FAD-dependent oxidoreductase n=1 Tax=Amycolatopsis sp. cg13 TaxID=3238807 RepID=UPI003526A7FB
MAEAGPAVLGPFPAKLRDCTRRHLEKMGVEVRLSAAATAMDAESITVQGPDEAQRIACRTKISAAGVQSSPVAGMLAEAAGGETDRAGRVAVNEDCTLPGRPEVFAIGDMVAPQGLPGVAEPAIQEGKYVADVIRARLDGEQGAEVPVFRQGQHGDRRVQRGGGERVRQCDSPVWRGI